ncbi:MAG: type II CAAX endopeptidase family protein [Eubacteriales bacterium]|nr:type II CAAX endopeptidase family protein [Eubacteriales bacterium]
MKEQTEYRFTRAGLLIEASLIILGAYFVIKFLRSYIIFPGLLKVLGNGEAATAVIPYLGHIGFLIILLIMLVVFPADKRVFMEMLDAGKGKRIKNILIGLLVGFLMNAGLISVAVMHGDMDMVWSNANLGFIVIAFFVVMFQSSVEELLNRSWFLARTKNHIPMPLVVFASSFVFSMIHWLNPGITVLAALNVFLAGVIFALSMYYTGNVIFACAYHTAWNFTQNFLFGLPCSGTPSSLAVMAPTFTKDSFFYDPAFGIEGTVFTMIMQVVVIIILGVLIKKRGRAI